MDELKWSRDERPGALSLLLFSLLMWLLATVQVGFFHRVPLFGAPFEIVAVTVCYLGWRRGAVVGCVSGLVGGIVLDSLSAQSSGWMICPLLFVGMALYMSFLAGRLFDRYLVYLAVLIAPFGVLCVYRGLLSHSARIAFATLLGGYLASALIYLPVLWRRRKGRK